MTTLIWMSLLLAAIAVMAVLPARAWCAIGMHHWDYPGGHCQDCGACDEFLGPHPHC